MTDSFDENPWKDAIIEDLEVVPPDRFYVVADNGQYFEIVPESMSMKLIPIDPSIIDHFFSVRLHLIQIVNIWMSLSRN